MFTCPPSVEPLPYTLGFLAFPPRCVPSTATEETRICSEQVRSHREQLHHEREALERVAAAQTLADRAWQKEEDARRERREKLKEQALKAEIEWERMGGRVRSTEEISEELRRKLDEAACWTEEERALRGAWEAYDKAWERITSSIRPVKTFTFRKVTFTFGEVPWPVLSYPAEVANLENITGPAVSKFLLHPHREPQKSRKEKLRDAVLRYHPDKFEGRILPRIIDEDRARVQKGVEIVMKCLNELMNAAD